MEIWFHGAFNVYQCVHIRGKLDQWWSLFVWQILILNRYNITACRMNVNESGAAVHVINHVTYITQYTWSTQCSFAWWDFNHICWLDWTIGMANIDNIHEHLASLWYDQTFKYDGLARMKTAKTLNMNMSHMINNNGNNIKYSIVNIRSPFFLLFFTSYDC